MEITLYKNSDRTIELTLRDVPDGDGVAKGYFAIKKNLNDADGSALVFKSTAVAGQGSIVDSGASAPNVAVIRFEISDTDFANLQTTTPYVFAAKVILASGKAVSPPSARGTLRVQPAGIQAAN